MSKICIFLLALYGPSLIQADVESEFVQKLYIPAGDRPAGSTVYTNETGSAKSQDEPVNLDKLLEIWNPGTVSSFWDPKKFEDQGLSIRCVKDISEHLQGLRSAKIWSLKMVDSNGKHGWGLFWGNKYWPGAPDLCRDLDKNFVQWEKSKIEHRPSDVPPFRVSVNAVKLNLTVLKPGLNETHEITLGLCLPARCSVKDVENLLVTVDTVIAADIPRNFSIQYIRNLNEGYSLLNDPIFYVIVAVFAVVIVLVIFGTLYDLALRYRVLREEEIERNTNDVISEMKIMEPHGNFREEITLAKLWSVKTHNGTLDLVNTTENPKPLSEALLSFSLLLNTSKLISLDVGEDTLAPIHGLRLFSMIWIILVHCCLQLNEFADNQRFRQQAEQDFFYQSISNANYAVDTFFTISGCLVAFLYVRTISKERIKKKKITKGPFGQFCTFLAMMWYRYFRLTPPYLLTIGLIQISMKWYHDHAMLEFPAQDYQTCEKYWWRHALYINTYFDMDDRCMVWSWYLANDTQFYTIGIIILIIGVNIFPIGVAIGTILLVSSWITTGIISYHSEYVPKIEDPFAQYESLYDKPWTRIGPYLIGMAIGWYLAKVNRKVKMNKLVMWGGWMISATLMLSIVYGIYGSNFSPVLASTHAALSHSGWSVGVAWIVVACATGHGGIVNQILSWKYLYPLSRLTYCAYLLHPALQRAMMLRSESSFHLSEGFLTFMFMGTVGATYVSSLFFSLLFEAPVVSLLRIAHPLRRWKSTNKN